MYKRFAFLSEPEEGERINIGLLKELTGSEEIVARALYEESTCFIMETKMYLACNKLPDIKAEDTIPLSFRGEGVLVATSMTQDPHGRRMPYPKKRKLLWQLETSCHEFWGSSDLNLTVEAIFTPKTSQKCCLYSIHAHVH